MKIALVTYALHIGGVETFLKLLANYFQEKGHKVDLIETQAKGRWSNSFSSLGYTVKQILPHPFRSRIHHAKCIAKDLMGYDAVILNDAPFAQAALGLLPKTTVAIPVLHMFMTTMVRNATSNRENWDVMAAVSPSARESAIQSGVEAERVLCIQNGIKVQDVWPRVGHDVEKHTNLKAIYVGAVNHSQKGVFYLPEIMSRVSSCEAVLLDVIGDGPDMPAFMRKVSEKNLASCIKVHGSLPGEIVREKMMEADVLIMPSHFEGLPITLLEAMSFGVVPICSLLQGSTDFVVDHGSSGMLQEVGDVEGFSNSLMELNTNRTLLHAMSIASWKKIRSEFSAERMGEAYLGLIITTQALRLNRGTGRSGEIDRSLLGDFAFLPQILIRPARKLLRSFGIFPTPQEEPLLFPLKNQ